MGLNLHGSRFVASADAESESRAALSPEVATFAAEYCERFAAAWRVAGAPERRPHPRHSRDAGYVVGLAEGVAFGLLASLVRGTREGTPGRECSFWGRISEWR